MQSDKSSLSWDKQLFFKKADFFKFLMFVIMIYKHTLNYRVYPITENAGFWGGLLFGVEKLELAVSGFISPVYFFISGFSFFLDYTPDKAPGKLKRRVFTLLIPWLLWNTITWALWILLEGIPAISAHINSDFGYEFSLSSWFFDALLGSADGPMWFIRNLIVAVLLAPLLYYVLKNKVAGIIVILCGYAIVLLTRVGCYSVAVTVLFFAEAGYLAIHMPSLAMRRYGKGLRIGAVCMMLVYFLFFSSQKIQNIGILHVLDYSVFFPAFWVAVDDIGLGPRAKAMEKHRFWVYASHYIPLECVEKLWLILAGTSVLAAYVDFFLAPVVTSALLILLSVCLEKICHPLWCLLSGKRIKKRRMEAA
ncbi:MAG: acyltransferase family protein [Candidatus Limivicinus sp.]|jgi:hypothetical protein